MILFESAVNNNLFSIFIRPIYDIEDLVTNADDNYTGEGNEDVVMALTLVKQRMERVTRWMAMSRLKINVKKTKTCIFHRRNSLVQDVEIMGEKVTTRTSVSILGIVFDSKML